MFHFVLEVVLQLPDAQEGLEVKGKVYWKILMKGGVEEGSQMLVSEEAKVEYQLKMTLRQMHSAPFLAFHL